jgi:hypothetical protein
MPEGIVKNLNIGRNSWIFRFYGALSFLKLFLKTAFTGVRRFVSKNNGKLKWKAKV